MSIATTPECKQLVEAIDRSIPADRASDLLHAFYEAVRTETRADGLREAIACLSGLADSVSERQQPGLDFAVGVLLDMVTGRNETTGGGDDD